MRWRFLVQGVIQAGAPPPLFSGNRTLNIHVHVNLREFVSAHRPHFLTPKLFPNPGSVAGREEELRRRERMKLDSDLNLDKGTDVKESVI